MRLGAPILGTPIGAALSSRGVLELLDNVRFGRAARFNWEAPRGKDGKRRAFSWGRAASKASEARFLRLPDVPLRRQLLALLSSFLVRGRERP